ncbi:putative ciliary rootlet coiled-coil protein 2 [Kryptolebias marmoratus]|uniref:putative ciliary rootlet coiled-coil protein 2 n=1 Tax=Kryptolebias marmoratus TaxID=37003 RepID=UPI0018ACE05D|nr:putative ciliary rootlet coiled-coil protein 2 [Kryptolebias marmoratus]
MNKKEKRSAVANQDKEKSFFLAQVRSLDEQLERAQLRCDELKEQNKDIVTKLRALQEDMRDILDYLQHLLAELERTEEDLTERLEQQLQADGQKTEALQLQLQQEEEELQQEAGHLSSQETEQAAELEDLEKQTVHLKQLLLHKDSVQDDLTLLQLRHQKEIQNLELDQQKRVYEKETEASSTLDMKVSAVVQEEGAQCNQMDLQLKSLTQQCSFLTSDKSYTHRTMVKMSTEINRMRVNRDKVNQKLFTLQKESERMQKRNKLLRRGMKNLDRSYQNMLDANEAFRQRLASVSEDCRQQASEISQLEAKLQRERSRRRKEEAEVQRAYSDLSAVIIDSDQNPDAQLKMEKLLKVLEIMEAQETEYRLQKSTEQIQGGPEPQTSEAEAAAGSETVNFDPDPLRPPPAQKQRAPPTGSPPPRDRTKLPPVKTSLWRLMLEKYID